MEVDELTALPESQGGHLTNGNLTNCYPHQRPSRSGEREEYVDLADIPESKTSRRVQRHTNSLAIHLIDFWNYSPLLPSFPDTRRWQASYTSKVRVDCLAFGNVTSIPKLATHVKELV